MELRNIFAICFDAVVVFILMKFVVYVLPLHLSIEGTYGFLAGVSTMHTIKESIRRKKGMVTPVWWMGPIGLGLGLGAWMLTIHPDSSMFNIPLLILASLITTVLVHNIIMRTIIKPH